MSILMIVLIVVAAWAFVSVALALFLGRAMRVSKQREQARVADRLAVNQAFAFTPQNQTETV